MKYNRKLRDRLGCVLAFVVGQLCGLLVYHEKFEWKKALGCFKEAMMLFVCQFKTKKSYICYE